MNTNRLAGAAGPSARPAEATGAEHIGVTLDEIHAQQTPNA